MYHNLDVKVQEITNIHEHEKGLLETVEEITTRSRRAQENQSRKRKREGKTTFGSLEQDVSIRIMHIHIQEIEEKNRKLNEELKRERKLRKKSEEIILSLREQLKSQKQQSQEKEDSLPGEEIQPDEKEQEECEENISTAAREEEKK